ncbi:Ctr-domain-containing protein [Piedraia hortae CBS 480.64]|uniref:Copper transport protein n=1 Tax=Piedraia hortae CBS 480.64 TaxID=1314780 RepID=A0A6A7BU86_9PEZI|nr:Ctr-domain-containing protein [Piedraia hortae CBS 480.64]
MWGLLSSGKMHSHDKMSGMDDMCSMNMSFTWSFKNLCIIFPNWRITSTFSLIVSLIVIVFLTAGYEGVRKVARTCDCGPPAHGTTERSALLPPNTHHQARSLQKSRIVKAALYAIQVAYSFFIMLLFMTYNGWIMLAVTVGAFFGYMIFSADEPVEKSVACH